MQGKSTSFEPRTPALAKMSCKRLTSGTRPAPSVCSRAPLERIDARALSDIMRSFVRDSRSRRLGSIAVDERRDVAKDWDRCRTRGKN